MPLNIKNEEAHRMARELAELTGGSITDAVTDAIRSALAAAKAGAAESKDRVVRELDEIALHCSSLDVLDHRSPEEIIGYDESGAPH